jgi:hypothetical protein
MGISPGVGVFFGRGLAKKTLVEKESASKKRCR